ncbi:uncharacterized protein LOC134256568 [Saccostrea cucullata]|uniref:uncharacterized protein LOC134256568 n=1 Tax=Saccostrea cuccullata TaxID=36930 RepID=UPI002ED40AC3
MQKRDTKTRRQIATNNASSICTDIDSAACLRLSKIKQGMCNDPCMAKACARTCGNCVGCYSCSHVTKTETCNNMVGCLPGEKCYTLETLTSAGEHGYKLGCVHENVCSSFHNQAGHIFGRRSDPLELSLNGDCCEGPLCNHHALVHPTPATGLSGCLYLSEDHHCPVGFELNAGRCYLVGDERYNFTEAQAFCAFHCSKLAEDLTVHDVMDLRGVVDDNYVLIGAVDPNHTGNFVWKTSGRPVPQVTHNGDRYSDNTCATLHFSRRDNPIVFSSYCHYHYRPLCQAVMK